MVFYLCQPLIFLCITDVISVHANSIGHQIRKFWVIQRREDLCGMHKHCAYFEDLHRNLGIAKLRPHYWSNCIPFPHICQDGRRQIHRPPPILSGLFFDKQCFDKIAEFRCCFGTMRFCKNPHTCSPFKRTNQYYPL